MGAVAGILDGRCRIFTDDEFLTSASVNLVKQEVAMKTVISFIAVSLLSVAGVSVAHADDGIDLSQSASDAFRSMDELQQQANDRTQQMQQQSADNAQREADEAQFRAQQVQEQQRLDSLGSSN
jgi:hypothetical protein